MPGSTGTPLGIGLAIDFANLDKDLGKVADHIANVGKDVSLRVGSLAGLAVKGDLKGDELAAQVSHIGIELSQGMSTGIRASSALMLSFGARINSMLDRLAGTAITMFSRIDSAMKFPKWDAAMTHMHVGLKNFWMSGKTGMSTLDMAMAGGFGKIAQTAAKILVPLFTNLGEQISKAIVDPMKAVLGSTTELADRMVKAMDDAANSISKSMTEAIDMIAEKMKGLQVVSKSAGEASAEAFMKGGGIGRPYVREFPPPPLKPTPTRIAKHIGGLAPEQREELLTKPPPPQEFIGKIPIPAMGKEFVKLMGDAVIKIKEFASYASNTRLASGITLFGQSLKIGTMGVIRFGAAFLDVVTLASRAFMRIRNFVTSFGAIHKQTYHKIFEDHGIFVGTVMAGIKTVQHLTRGLWDLVTLKAFRKVGDDAQKFGSSVKTSTQMLGNLIGSVKTLVVEAAGLSLFIGIGYKINEFFKTSVKSASDLNETVSRTQVVFGDAFGPIEEQSNRLAKSFGINKNASMDVAAGFGAMATGAGYSQKQAAELATQMTQMAADLSSSVNIPFQDAAEKIRSALAGEARPLREFGADILETSVQAQTGAMRMGKLAGSIFDVGRTAKANPPKLSIDFDLGKQTRLIKEHSENAAKALAVSTRRQMIAATHALPVPVHPAPAWKPAPARAAMPGGVALATATDEQLKIAARATLVTKGLNYAVGDLDRTANQTANQWRKAGGGVSLFAEKIGEVLLPAVNSVTVGFNALMGTVLDLIDRVGPALKGWAASGSESVNTVIENIKKFGPNVIENLTWAWEESKKGPLSFVTSTLEWIGNLAKDVPAMLGIMIRYPGELWKIATLQVGEFVENSIRWIETFPENFSRIFKWIGRNWWNLLVDMGSAIKAIGFNYATNWANLFTAIWDAAQGKDWKFVWTPLLDGFQATTEQLPEMIKPDLIDVSNEVKSIYDKIGKMEIERPKIKEPTAVTPGPKKPPIGPEVERKEYKLAGALEWGSKEAFSAISRGLTAGRQNELAKRGLEVQGRIADNTAKTNDLLSKQGTTTKVDIK